MSAIESNTVQMRRNLNGKRGRGGCLFLAECSCDLVLERPHEVGDDRAHRRLDEDLDRHAGDELYRFEPGDFLGGTAIRTV